MNQHSIPLENSDIRSFRARDINSYLLEQDHDYHRDKVKKMQSKQDSLVKGIADRDARISQLNVELALKK